MEEPHSGQKNRNKGEMEIEVEGKGKEQEGAITESPQRPSRASVGILEVRRLSLAMTRVASELRNAANQHAASMGPASLARGLTLGGHPTNIGPMDYGRGTINWYGNFTSSELTHMRRLSQWQNFT
ncbi:hypothetical protein TcWFU_004189 [Taenia crassiceps]|uniref:Uncharacterized protein n=1 Tax=Taenia crassiceps TaxID=6207 RepID=A0ABR4Q8Y6_9CEST